MHDSKSRVVPVHEPQQARARATFNALLLGAQHILQEDGINGLNSNLIAERAELTPPSFYRYFQNKFSILAVLGQRLMDAQNSVLDDAESLFTSKEGLAASIEQSLGATLFVTENFIGSHALLAALRAIPDLRSIRLDSHDHMAKIITDQATAIDPDLSEKSAYARGRLSVEFGYACVEMLMETDTLDRPRTIRQASRAIAAIYT